MWMSWVIVFLVVLQPICTRSQFEHVCKDVLNGESKSIAHALYEAYLDQVHKVDETNQLLASEQVAGILFEFTQSLSLLDEEGNWQTASDALQRSVLLQSRQSANPWPATVWVDLSTLDGIHISTETERALDLFLEQHYEDDLRERFAALDAMAMGNIQVCAQLTKNSMQRWSEFQEIIEPYMVFPQVRLAAYPKLNSGQAVRDVVDELLEMSNDESIQKEFQRRLQSWSNWHTTQLQATVAMVKRARSTYLFDPWSPRCSLPTDRRATELQHQLLQLSAAVREKNKSTISALQELVIDQDSQ